MQVTENLPLMRNPATACHTARSSRRPPPRALCATARSAADLPYSLAHADPDKRRLPFLIPNRRAA